MPCRWGILAPSYFDKRLDERPRLSLFFQKYDHAVPRTWASSEALLSVCLLPMTLLHARKLDESTVHLILRDAVKLAHVDVLCDTAVPR